MECQILARCYKMKRLESFEVKGKAQPFLCTLCWNDAMKEGFYCGYIEIRKIFKPIFKNAQSLYKRWKIQPPEEITFSEMREHQGEKVIVLGFDTGHYLDFYGIERTKETDEVMKARLTEFAEWADAEIVARNYGIEAVK